MADSLRDQLTALNKDNSNKRDQVNQYREQLNSSQDFATELAPTVLNGKLAGRNRIEREYGGCVLHERYDTGRGYTGESLNAFDQLRGTWHQTWVDSSGLLLLIEGGLVDVLPPFAGG